MPKLFKKKNIFLLLILIIGGYFGYQAISGIGDDNEAPRYILAAVEKGTLDVSVSGSGQVSVLDQLDIKSKVSGDVVYVGAEAGQVVKAGDLLVQIDSRDAQKAVRDAERSLETAKLELEKLLQPADDYSLMQAENALIQAKDNLAKLKLTQESQRQDVLDAIEKAEDNLEKAYEDAFNIIANTFLDLPTIITGLENILYSYEIDESEAVVSGYMWNLSVYRNFFANEDRHEIDSFLNNAEDDYHTARENYDQNLENYKNASRYSERKVIELLLDETIETTKSIAETVKSETNLLDFIVDYLSSDDRQWRIYDKITEYQADLKTYTSKTNTHLLNLLSVQRTIEDNKESKLNAERDLAEMDHNNPLDLAAAERTIQEKEEALSELKEDPDELDVKAKKIAIQQKEDALLSAQQNLSDHYIYAPFDGIVADINIKKGDPISSGSIVATLINNQKIAEITLNEVDVVNVKVGQKATLTFDALPEFSISGKVIEVDTIGQVTQGVVNYGVKIAFDIYEEQIKPGMSVTADIITETKSDVLILPSSAIKSQGNSYYIELVETDGQSNQHLLANATGTVLSKPPKRQPVEIGLSNDFSTEIVSGLKEGDLVVIQTISSNFIQNTGQQNEGINSRMPGMPRMIR